MIEVAILIAVHFLSCYYWYQAGKDKGRKEEQLMDFGQDYTDDETDNGFDNYNYD